MKLEDDVCPIHTLIEFSNFYLNNQLLNKTILHFIAFSLMEHLRIHVTIKTFEQIILPMYDLITSFYHLNENSETLTEFFEEFKSCIFHNRFLDTQVGEISDPLNMFTISYDTIVKICHMHKRLNNSIYYDSAFDSYLDKSIKLNKSLLFIC